LKISKAIFPVAGLGTRFLPATKANPKEMLPIVDKPLIQYAVEEAIEAGITECIFVTSHSKRSIEDHFDSSYELESLLEERGNLKMLSVVRDILPAGVSCAYVRQPRQLGLGHAVLCAQPLIGNEPFVVLLADDLIDGNGQGCISQMMEIYQQTQSSVIAAQSIDRSETDKYGIIALDPKHLDSKRMANIVEKPTPDKAPSTLGVVGRYILTPRIFDFLKEITPGAGGEIQLTDAIAKLLLEECVTAYPFKGTRYDCGSKLGYLKATVEYAKNHPEIGGAFQAYLDSLLLPV
jgi:UTP--glucose-1-phosphate uridylyltransferase